MGSVVRVAAAATLRHLGEIKHREFAVTINTSLGTHELIPATRGTT